MKYFFFPSKAPFLVHCIKCYKDQRHATKLIGSCRVHLYIKLSYLGPIKTKPIKPLWKCTKSNDCCLLYYLSSKVVFLHKRNIAFILRGVVGWNLRSLPGTLISCYRFVFLAVVVFHSLCFPNKVDCIEPLYEYLKTASDSSINQKLDPYFSFKNTESVTIF